MLNQFHDVLPGSSIAWVHREAREDYRRDLKRLAEIAQDMCAVLRKATRRPTCSPKPASASSAMTARLGVPTASTNRPTRFPY